MPDERASTVYLCRRGVVVLLRVDEVACMCKSVGYLLSAMDDVPVTRLLIDIEMVNFVSAGMVSRFLGFWTVVLQNAVRKRTMNGK